MGASTGIPQVSESEARGPTAEIYADIRATLRLPIVNLVWRHLATRGDALPRVWRAVRPVYASGLCAAAAVRMNQRMKLPVMEEITVDVARGAGVGAADVTGIWRILEVYHRANPLNLMALRAVELRLAAEHAAAERVPPSLPIELPELDAALPPIPGAEAISETTARLIAVLDAMGADLDTDFPPTVYRHLAYWPGFLGLACERLQPLHESGALQAAIGELQQVAEREAIDLIPYVAGADAIRQASNLDVRDALSQFTRQALPRLIVIVGLLRQALAGLPGR